MKRVCVAVFLLLSVLAWSDLIAQTAPVTMTLVAERPQLVNSESMSLVVSLKSTSFAGGTLLLSEPAQCSVTPKEVKIPPFSDLYETLDVKVSCTGVESARTVRVRLQQVTPTATSVFATGSASFTYLRRIAVWMYFLLGAGGIAVGYLLRIVMQVQKTITPEEPFVEGESAKPGPITAFVTNHYYAVDFSVCLTLGLLSMLLLLKSGHVPDESAYWYEALVLGVGLGLLTNTDLVLRVRPR